MADENNAQGTYSDEKFAYLITDFFGLTNNGEVKGTGIERMAKNIGQIVVDHFLETIENFAPEDIKKNRIDYCWSWSII